MPDVYKAPTVSKNPLDKVIAKSTVLQRGESTGNPITSFSLLPDNMQFDVQHADEHILLFLRQHFIVNVGWIVLTVFLAFLPTLVGIFQFLSFLPTSFQQVLFFAWYLVVFGYAFERFVVWYYNVYIITDERIIDIDFFSLLFKRVSEAKLDHIQDITSASGGVIQSVFDYGDVLIQTAAEVPEIEFEQVPHPDLVTKLLSELIDKEEIEHTGKK